MNQATTGTEPGIFQTHSLKGSICYSFKEHMLLTSCPLHSRVFIHSSNMHSSAYSVPGAVLGARDPAGAAVDKVTAPVVLTI